MSQLEDRSIHQLLVTAVPGDAVTNTMLEIRSLLRKFGSSEAFACHVHDDLRGDVHHISEYGRHVPRGRPLTLVHVSMGDEHFLPFVRQLRGDLIVSYHNLTPATYFARWDPPTAHRLELGRTYLSALRDRTVAALADSMFNAGDLEAAGYSDVQVAGLIISADVLAGLPRTDPVGPPDGPVVLSVGQLYPHKRPDILIAAFHELLTRYRSDAHLVLAGSARLPAYAAAVRRYLDRLGLSDQVTVTGHLSDEELAAWYRRADLFVMASDHEGFCVPLVEAMHFDLPIVARANGAVAETIGGAGALLPGDAGPAQLAAALAALLDDEAARRTLVERGAARREDFSAEACRRRFVGALETVL